MLANSRQKEKKRGRRVARVKRGKKKRHTSEEEINFVELYLKK